MKLKKQVIQVSQVCILYPFCSLHFTLTDFIEFPGKYWFTWELPSENRGDFVERTSALFFFCCPLKLLASQQPLSNLKVLRASGKCFDKDVVVSLLSIFQVIWRMVDHSGECQNVLWSSKNFPYCYLRILLEYIPGTDCPLLFVWMLFSRFHFKNMILIFSFGSILQYSIR